MLEELNQESLLMLYLADELSVRDRAAVDARLVSDSVLREQLEHLETTTQAFAAQMAELDAMPMMGESRAAARIGRVMRQRIADKLAQPETVERVLQPKSRYPWWVYPGIAAAVVMITFISWWGNRADTMMVVSSPDPHAIHPGPANSQVAVDDEIRMADDLQHNFEASNPAQPEKSVASLNAAEDQIAELSHAQEDFHFTNGN